jgi:hypothetical protein
MGVVGIKMDGITEHEEGEAREIIEQILEPDRRGYGPIALREFLSVIDVQHAAAQFRADIDILELVDVRVPTMRVGHDAAVPISLSLVIGIQGLGPTSERPGLLHDLFREYLVRSRSRDSGKKRGAPREPFGDIETISHEEARTTFRERAAGFLAIRIAALRQFERGWTRRFSDAPLNVLQQTGGARVNAPGCSFSVSANSAGLRVFWSGAYYIAANYFGQPTSFAFPVPRFVI